MMGMQRCWGSTALHGNSTLRHAPVLERSPVHTPILWKFMPSWVGLTLKAVYSKCRRETAQFLRRPHMSSTTLRCGKKLSNGAYCVND